MRLDNPGASSDNYRTVTEADPFPNITKAVRRQQHREQLRRQRELMPEKQIDRQLWSRWDRQAWGGMTGALGEYLPPTSKKRSKSAELAKRRKRQRRRQRVFERDGNRCVQCGTTENLTVDHIVPLSRGGPKGKLSNLQTLCRPCNNAKADRLDEVA